MRFDPRTGMRLITGIHEFWYRMTDGLIGGNFMGAPILLLTTTGRKTARRRTTPLLYLKDGNDIVVIASNGGSDRHPEWWLNLRANPNAQIQAGSLRRDVRAEETGGEERVRLWADITRGYPVYRQYERQTTREIPVVRLTSTVAAPGPSSNGTARAAARPASAATKPKRAAARRSTKRKARTRSTRTARRRKTTES